MTPPLTLSRTWPKPGFCKQLSQPAGLSLWLSAQKCAPVLTGIQRCLQVEQVPAAERCLHKLHVADNMPASYTPILIPVPQFCNRGAVKLCISQCCTYLIMQTALTCITLPSTSQQVRYTQVDMANAPCLSKYLFALVGADMNFIKARGMVRYLM